MRTPFRRSMLVLGLLAVAGPSMAQSLSQPACGPEAAQLLVQAAQQQQVATATLNKEYLDPLRQSPDSLTSTLSSCVDSQWPNPAARLPSMEQIIRGVAMAAAQKLCGEARSQLSSVTSQFNQSYYLNTGIPGMPSIGGSLSNSGGSVVNSVNSAVGGTSSTTGSTWDSVSGLFK